MKDGTANATSPHSIPMRKALATPSAIRKDNPAPNVVNRTEAMMIVRVDGKATRLMKL